MAGVLKVRTPKIILITLSNEPMAFLPMEPSTPRPVEVLGDKRTD